MVEYTIINWNTIKTYLYQKENAMKIDRDNSRKCRELFEYIEMVKRRYSFDSYYFVRELNVKISWDYRDRPAVYYLRDMCNNILDLKISTSELLFAIAFSKIGNEKQTNPADFAIQVKRQMCDDRSDDIFLKLCKMEFYEGLFNKDDLEKIVEELDNEDITKLFLDIDFSKRPTWEEIDYSKQRNRYSEKKVKYSYNKCIAELLQKRLSNEDQYKFVFNRYWFINNNIFDNNDSDANWGLSYYLIDRLGKR